MGHELADEMARKPAAPPTFGEMFNRMLEAQHQSKAAKTVESFGWLIFIEAILIVVVPQACAALLGMPDISEQSANFFRLAGVLIGGLGMLYIVSGRLGAQGFVFASMLDRPLVPVVMLVFWYAGVVSGPMALVFSIQDFGSFLWTLHAWHKDRQASTG